MRRSETIYWVHVLLVIEQLLPDGAECGFGSYLLSTSLVKVLPLTSDIQRVSGIELVFFPSDLESHLDFVPQVCD